MSNSLKQMAYDTIEAHQETIADLRAQLAKANKLVKELEQELKESEDDLDAAEQQLSSYENALEEVQAVFVDSDACPLFEPFNPRNLSAWLNKFAIEKSIEALKNTLRENSRPIAYPHGQNTDVIYSEDIEFDIEQLRKEQE